MNVIDRPRRRKLRTIDGQWYVCASTHASKGSRAHEADVTAPCHRVFENELQGLYNKTIEHSDVVEDELAASQRPSSTTWSSSGRPRSSSSSSKKKKDHEDGIDDSNAFQLIPCRQFDQIESRAPFQVTVALCAAVLMDIHSHLTHTEVIGLLGGRMSDGSLQVQVAIPCNSVSTDIQCEMDPVSETHAREVVAAMNMEVVGWYHSHPTFAPNPSVRDIENQSNYQVRDFARVPGSQLRARARSSLSLTCRLPVWQQRLFAREDGSEPFIGVIVTPYNTSSASLVSDMNVITISHSRDTNGYGRLTRRPSVATRD